VFWKAAANDDSSGCDDVDTGGSHQRFISRVYHVFNEDQVDGAEPGRARPATSPAERIAAAETFIAATGANIRHGGVRAAYVPGIDQIWLPRFEQFRDAQSYYATLAHETVHWSGAKHRLDRDLTGRFGNDAYAMEELVAELGSAFIAGHLGISVEPRPDHAAYLSSWLRVLRNDPRAILTASAKAQQAVDYLIAPPAAQSEPCSPGDASCFDPGNCDIERPASGRMAMAAGAILPTTRSATNDGDHTHSMPSLRARS
jgi:antirestriction protein ArdC